MNRFDLEILHSIRGRLRLKFIHGLQDPEEAFQFICAKGGVKGISYNPVIRTATIDYCNYITLDEVLSRAAVACVLKSKRGHVCIYDQRRNKPAAIMPCGQGALAMVLANIAAHLILPQSVFLTAMKWATVGITGYAIIEHGYKELNERGSFDPEVMSVVYLFDTINQGSYYAPAIAWTLTFGRHLLERNRGCIDLSIEQDEKTQTDYIVETVDSYTKQKPEYFSQLFPQRLPAGQRTKLTERRGMFVVSGC